MRILGYSICILYLFSMSEKLKAEDTLLQNLIKIKNQVQSESGRMQEDKDSIQEFQNPIFGFLNKKPNKKQLYRDTLKSLEDVIQVVSSLEYRFEFNFQNNSHDMRLLNEFVVFLKYEKDPQIFYKVHEINKNEMKLYFTDKYLRDISFGGFNFRNYYLNKLKKELIKKSKIEKRQSYFEQQNTDSYYDQTFGSNEMGENFEKMPLNG